MLLYVLRNILFRWRTVLLTLFIILAIGLSGLYTLQTVEKIQLTSTEFLSNSWRTGYDLLVMPAEANKAEEYQQLVRTRYLENIKGGISLEQYEQIKQIEGVQVAAPLSFIGYLESEGMGIQYSDLDHGFYAGERRVDVFDGVRYRNLISENEMLREYMSATGYAEIRDNLFKIVEDGGFVPVSVMGSRMRSSEHSWLIVGVDPEQEAKLVNLEEAVVEGTYLSSELLPPVHGQARALPLMLLNQTYDVKNTNTLYKINVDEDMDRQEIIAQGGQSYLENLPRTIVHEIDINPYSSEYLFFFGDLIIKNDSIQKENKGFSWTDTRDLYEYSEVNLEQVDTWGEMAVYKAQPVGTYGEQINYRNVERSRLVKSFGFDVYGLFDASRLKYVYATSPIPQPPDFYNPDQVYITHNSGGQAYEERIVYHNSPQKSGYYTGGIDAITNLAAAEFLLGDQPISIIRVVIDGVGERSVENQAKIEAIAQQIMDETGLHVEVMLGGVDRKVQILLDDYEGIEGYGTLLEGWHQSGTSFVLEERINQANVLITAFIGIMGIIGLSLFLRNDFETRKRHYKTLFVCGWSQRKISGSIWLEKSALLLGACAWLVMYYFFFGQTWSLVDLCTLLAFLILLYIGTFCIFYLFPLVNLLQNEKSVVKAVQKSFFFTIETVWGYMISMIIRNRIRSLLKIIVIASSFVYIWLFMTTQSQTSNFLLLTFLGEAIDLTLQPYQWFLFVLGVVLALISYVGIQVNQMEERTREVQIFHSFGKSRSLIYMIYLLEEGIISIVAVSIGVGIAALLINLEMVRLMVPLTYILLVPLSLIVSVLLIGLTALMTRSQHNQLKEFQ